LYQIDEVLDGSLDVELFGDEIPNQRMSIEMRRLDPFDLLKIGYDELVFNKRYQQKVKPTELNA